MLSSLSLPLAIEILATGANLLYLLLLIRENILCWAFGIVGSALSVWLFIHSKLYSEALLYSFYALMGCWGWLRWRRQSRRGDNLVITWPASAHLRAILFAACCGLGLGYLAHSLSDAQRPFFDATTTAFSFLATYLEINKVLEGWLYWFALNIATIWLYHDRNLDVYAVLIGIYALLSLWGFVRWRQSWRQAQSGASAGT